ncbi:MAG: zinc ribbon domain-containing protein [Betaproteobacteria bacterium]|nr:zinc ribbon domain-containing protein [Betaproteobacteria bacterium]
MLIKCPECTKEVSDQATSCPHCGHPLLKSDSWKALKPKSRNPVFLALGFVCLVLAFTTPRFLVFFPLFGAVAFSIVSAARRESGAVFTVLILIVSVFVWMATSAP